MNSESYFIQNKILQKFGKYKNAVELFLGRSEPTYEVIHDNKHEHYQYHKVAHDLSVGLPAPEHHIHSTQRVAQKSTGAIKILSDPVKQPVMVLGLALDVHGQGFEEGGLL